MKHNTFIVTMVIEGFFALVSMGLLFPDMGALIYPISFLLFAVVLAPFFICLRRTSDQETKRKIRRNIALVLLIPIVVALAMIALIIIALMSYF